MTFSEPVEWDDQDMEIRKASDDSLVAYLDISPSSIETTGNGTSVIIINPTNNLDYSTEYYILITNQNFKSVASGTFFAGVSNTTEWSFTTAANSTTPPTNSTNSSSGGMVYVCTDPTAINYSSSSFGKSNSSICQYTTTDVNNSSVTTILNSGVCSADLLITNNMKQGDKNGKYSSYNKGTVTQIKLLQQHINRILAAQYKQAAGPIDGIYGPMTKKGVQRLQTVLRDTLHLDLGPAGVDGVVGGYTKEAINNSCGK